MKKNFIITSLAALALCACQQTVNREIVNNSFSEKKENWNIEINYSTLESEDQTLEKAFAPYNQHVESLVKEQKATFTEEAKRISDLMDSKQNEHIPTFLLLTNDTVYIADNNWVSTRIESYSYQGGANGMLSYRAINYDVANKQFLEKNDLFKADKSEELNALLKANLIDPCQCYTFDAPTLDNCSAVNIGKDSLYFSYEKYILGPGACGPVTITVARKEMKDILNLK